MSDDQIRVEELWTMLYISVPEGVFLLVVLNSLYYIPTKFQLHQSLRDYKKKIQFRKINIDWKINFVHCNSFHLLDSLGKAIWQGLTSSKLSKCRAQMQVINK